MKKSKCEAVIFDFFGTLVPIFTVNPYMELLNAMAGKLGVPADRFKEKWINTFSERASGKIPDVYSNIIEICRELSVSPDKEQIEAAVEMRLAFARNNIQPKNGVIKTLSKIKSSGFRLGLITDCSSEVPQLWEETEFAPYFDATLFSCIEGIKKPDPAIYMKACALLKVAPQKCLYIGDGGSHELTGAKNVGMRPVLIFDHNERNNPNIHRLDGEEWEGPIIYSFNEVLGLLGK